MRLSEYEVPKRHEDSPVFPRLQEKAEFITSNRVQEIVENKPNPTLDDVIVKS